MYKLQWVPKALRQLEKIKNRKVQLAIFNATSLLNSFPECKNIKQLKGYNNSFRLRVGRYRIIFSVENTIKLISITEVKKRDERTY